MTNAFYCIIISRDIFITKSFQILVHLAWAVEYTDCIPAER